MQVQEHPKSHQRLNQYQIQFEELMQLRCMENLYNTIDMISSFEFKIYFIYLANSLDQCTADALYSVTCLSLAPGNGNSSHWIHIFVLTWKICPCLLETFWIDENNCAQ
eukprot:291544_1